METEIQNYINVLEDLRDRFKKLVGLMDAKQLNWVPINQDVNSPHVLTYHIVSSEEMWIHQIAGKHNLSRNREAEFLVKRTDPRILIERLNKVAKISNQVINTLTLEDLAQLRREPPWRDEGYKTVRWCIVHVIEHYAEHLGHLNLTNQLYQIK
jgi:uncharacterized damage-inducible protein DinB